MEPGGPVISTTHGGSTSVLKTFSIPDIEFLNTVSPPKNFSWGSAVFGFKVTHKNDIMFFILQLVNQLEYRP